MEEVFSRGDYGANARRVAVAERPAARRSIVAEELAFLGAWAY
jgi:hypothetical protein